MKQYVKTVFILVLVVITSLAAHDLFYWNQKKAIFTDRLKNYTKKRATNPDLLRFTSLEAEIILPQLEIKGVIPAWLEGTLVRNSAAKFETSTALVHHPFDGCAMLHMFSFKGGSVAYANKFLETNYYNTALKEGTLGKGFSGDPCKLIFANFLSYFKPKAAEYDNANVHVAKIAEKFVALTETPMPIEFDLKTVKTIGPVIFDDTLKGQVTTAHPHYDPKTGESFNYLTHFGRQSFYHLYSIPFKSKARKLIASIPVEKPSYMHSFSLTRNYIILTEIPFRVDPLHLLFTNKPFIKNFVWNPQEGTIFTIVNRSNGEIVGRIKGEPFFTFHHVNAYEDGETIVLDLIAYKDPSVLDDLSFERLFNQPQGAPSEGLKERCLTRYSIDLKKGSVTSTILSTLPVEMPRINQAYNMKPYTFVYASHFADDTLVKISVPTGATLAWGEKNCLPSEPVFVAAPNARAEDDGVILSVIVDTLHKTSFLLVLDAHTFTEIGRALVPHHIPFQVHGEFFKD